MAALGATGRWASWEWVWACEWPLQGGQKQKGGGVKRKRCTVLGGGQSEALENIAAPGATGRWASWSNDTCKWLSNRRGKWADDSAWRYRKVAAVGWEMAVVMVMKIKMKVVMMIRLMLMRMRRKMTMIITDMGQRVLTSPTLLFYKMIKLCFQPSGFPANSKKDTS